MYSLKNEVLQDSDPYKSNSNGLVAMTVGDVPDAPSGHNAEEFLRYLRVVFEAARRVIVWWTPAHVEREALRMAGDADGPSLLSGEAYVLRGVYLKLASLMADWAPNVPTLTHARRSQMFCDLIHQAVTTIEGKAQQIEARAMDLRLRYDAQQLRAIITGHEVVSRLGRLIEAAQRDNGAQGQLLQLVAELREPLDRAAQALGSIMTVADWYWDRVIDKDAEARKLSTMLTKVGAKTTEVAVAGLFSALASKLLPK